MNNSRSYLTGTSHEDSWPGPDKLNLKDAWSAHGKHRVHFGIQGQNSAEKPLSLVPSTYLKNKQKQPNNLKPDCDYRLLYKHRLYPTYFMQFDFLQCPLSHC